MKYIFTILLLSLALNASWKMFSGKEGTFIYNEESGETFRYYQVVDSNTLKEEGLVSVNFTSYAKYPVGDRMVSPRGVTPKEMKTMEQKLIDSLMKK